MNNELKKEKPSFGYEKMPYRYVAYYRDGKWCDGELTTDEKVVLNESAGVLQYAQTCFEGVKAFKTKDGSIVVFRPDMNAERMRDSAMELEMPPFPKDRFLEAVKQVVTANKEYVPEYGSGAALYLRPVMFGTNAVLGVKPCEEYQFRLFASPVGPYFKGGVKPLKLKVSEYDRAAPRGTGNIKAGLNYAMSMRAITEAHREGYSENVYLDPATRTKIEETGGANVIFVTKEGTLVTPKSNSILPSITRKSLLYVAEHYLGMKVEHREVYLSELKDFIECGLCGTAAVIAPVASIATESGTIEFPSGEEKAGEYLTKLRETLVKIQSGDIESPQGWLVRID